MTPKPDVEAWAVKCAEAIAEDHFWHAPPSAIDQIAALIASHAEAPARARERAVVEEILRLTCHSCDDQAIRERYAEILREEGKP